MFIVDVNILIYAFRIEMPQHARCSRWLASQLAGSETLGLPDQVLSSFARLVTNPRIFDDPSPLDRTLDFVQQLRASPLDRQVPPGPNHWDIFTKLCRQTRAVGNLLPDAWLAATAIEQNAELITADRDFAKFPDLRWQRLLVHT